MNASEHVLTQGSKHDFEFKNPHSPDSRAVLKDSFPAPPFAQQHAAERHGQELRARYGALRARSFTLGGNRAFSQGLNSMQMVTDELTAIFSSLNAAFSAAKRKVRAFTRPFELCS